MAVASVRDGFTVGPATVDDVPFLALSSICAERGAGAVGVWDLLLNHDGKAQACADPATAPVASPSTVVGPVDNDELIKFLSPALSTTKRVKPALHWSRYHVIRDTATGRPVAAAVGYEMPDSSLFDCLRILLEAAAAPTRARVEANRDVFFGFIGGAVAPMDSDGYWVVESVFVDPAFRGKGLAQAVVQAVINHGLDTTRCRGVQISCAVGNAAAEHVYTSLGLTVVGEPPRSEQCQRLLGIPGFKGLIASRETLAARRAGAATSTTK